MAKHHKIISNQQKAADKSKALSPLEKRYDNFAVRCIVTMAILLFICRIFWQNWTIYFNTWVPFIIGFAGFLFGLPAFYLIRKYGFKFTESFGSFITDIGLVFIHGFLSVVVFGSIFYYSFLYLNTKVAGSNKLQFERCRVYGIKYLSGKGSHYRIDFSFLGRDESLFRYSLGPHMTEVFNSGKYADSHFDLYYRKGWFDSYVIEDHSFVVK